MTRLLENNGNGHYFYIIGLISAGILLFVLPNRRKSFVIPTLLMGLFIANPWFKDLWVNKLHLRYYWRILWIVPVMPLCAALPAMLSEKIKNGNLKGLVAIIVAAVFALTGSFVYTSPGCLFTTPATNYAKLPQNAVDVADFLLAREENPRVIADKSISIYLRQYDGHIFPMYARDIDGYIYGPSDSARQAHSVISDPDGDLSIIAGIMREENFRYLVVKDGEEERKRQLSINHFEKIGQVSEYGIYILPEDI